MAQNTPSFNFYSSDFLTGTLFMEDHEVGKYAKLMCVQHQKGHLTLSQMEIVCKGPVPKNVMDNYIQDDQGLYYNKKLERVIADKKEFCETKVKNLGPYMGKSRKEIAEIKAGLAENSEKPLPDAPSTQNPGDIQNSDEQSSGIFKPPSVEEVISFFLEHSYDENLAKRAWEGYEVAGWKDSQGKPIQNWKQKMIHVWFKEELKSKDDQLITYNELIRRHDKGEETMGNYEPVTVPGKTKPMWRKKKDGRN